MKISWAWVAIVLILAFGSLGIWYANAWSTRRSKVENHVARAEMAASQSRWPAAASELQAALDLDPNSDPAWLTLADVQFRQGRLDEALASVAHISSRSASGTAARLLEGTLLLKLGRASHAEEILRECLRLDPRSIEARRRLVFLYAIELRRSQLRRTLWELYDLNATGLTDMVLLSGSTFIVWNAAEIMGMVEGFVASDSGDVFARVALGRYRMRQSDLDGARQILQQACRIASDDLEAHVALADCLIDRNEIDEATRLLKRIPPHWTWDPRLAYCHARIAETVDRTEEAIISYGQTVRADPDHREAHYRLGQLLVQSDKGREADAFLVRARKLAERESLLSKLVSSQDGVTYAPMIARLEVELEHKRLADAWYAEALRQSPNDATLQAEAAEFSMRATADPDTPVSAKRSVDRRSP